MATPRSGVNRWLKISWRPKDPGDRPDFKGLIQFDEHGENEALGLVEYGFYQIEVTNGAPRTLALWMDGQPMETRVYGTWNWDTDDYAGLHSFEISTGAGERYQTSLRVFPRKMLVPAYTRMKQELSEIALDLLLRLDSPAHEHAIYGTKSEETSALHDYIQIKAIMKELGEIMSQLRRNPLHALREHSLQQDWQHVTHFSSEAIPLPGNVQTIPALVARQRVTYLPEIWMTREHYPTCDTYENRLLKRFLQQQLLSKLLVIEKKAEREEKQLTEHCARYTRDDDSRDQRDKMRSALLTCQELKERCLRWSSEPFLKEVSAFSHDGKATQILLKDPTYSRFYRLYLHFQQHLKITRDAQQFVEELSLKKTSALYELWSVFTVSRMLIDELMSAGYQIISNNTFYEIKKDYFQFDVKTDTTSSIVLSKNDLRVVFRYEPIYENYRQNQAILTPVSTLSGNTTQKPDLAIEIYQNHQPRAILIFDAKSQREKGRNGQTLLSEKTNDKIQSYLTTIAYQDAPAPGSRQASRFTYLVSSSYGLYPGKDLWQSPPNQYNQSTGALPLLPHMAPHRLDEVRRVVKDLLHQALLF
jgi:hypothetical protein